MITYRQVFKAGTQWKEFYKEILHNYVNVQESFFSYFHYKVQAEIYMSYF